MEKLFGWMKTSPEITWEGREPKGVNVHISYLTSDLFSIGV